VRIAISGTHGSGKSTLIEDFLAAHPEYAHEPEPYEWLDNASVEVDDFLQQLEISVERLRTHPAGANVIAERAPLDFLAYILALMDLRRAPRDCELLASAAELAATAMPHVDLLVVLSDEIEAPADEDPELRAAMHEQLVELVNADPYSLLANTRVIEVAGGRRTRLELVR